MTESMSTRFNATAIYECVEGNKPDGQAKSLDDRHRQVDYSSLKKIFVRVGFLYRVLAKLEK